MTLLFPSSGSTTPAEYLLKSATISNCGRYRYSLMRRVGDGPVLTWLMLNPSRADALVDDPTIRKVKGFTSRAGYGVALVVNLFAWRATSPGDCLFNLADATGPENCAAIMQSTSFSAGVVCAWGARKWARERAEEVLGWLVNHPDGPRDLLCLGVNQDGSPRHPLLVPYSQPLVGFDASVVQEWR